MSPDDRQDRDGGKGGVIKKLVRTLPPPPQQAQINTQCWLLAVVEGPVTHGLGSVQSCVNCLSPCHAWSVKSPVMHGL